MRILVVDDDPHSLRRARDARLAAGCAQLVTGEPRERAPINRARRPHLVLPGPDGITLTQHLAERRALPVLFISACGGCEALAMAG